MPEFAEFMFEFVVLYSLRCQCLSDAVGGVYVRESAVTPRMESRRKEANLLDVLRTVLHVELLALTLPWRNTNAAAYSLSCLQPHSPDSRLQPAGT